MKKESKKQPKLRFPGFINDWKASKLSEMSTIKTGPFGTQLSAKEYVKAGVPVINVKNIGNNSIIEDNLDYVSANTALRLQDHTLLSGDIVFGRKGALNRHAIIRKEQEGWLQGSDCIRVRTNENINSDYVNSYLQTSRVAQHLVRNAYGSTMLTLTTDMISSIPVLLPEEYEQYKIGELFKRIESFIKLHQHKYEQLELLKKGLMQKLFSQEVRFKADDGSDFPEWEEKKLWNVADVIMGQSPDGDSVNLNDGLYLIQGKADLLGSNIVPERFTNKPTKICEPLDLVMTVRAPVGYVVRIEFKACIGRGVCAIRAKKIDSNYLLHYMTFKENEWKKIEQGSTFTAVNSEDVKMFRVSVPCPAEQQKIADCLSALDEVIEKKKTTLAAWEELKKGLLQQMFV